MGGDVSVDNETLLMIDFINFKIKSTQSFRCAHMNRVYVRVFIEMSHHSCMNIYVYYECPRTDGPIYIVLVAFAYLLLLCFLLSFFIKE
jgi:hypothetical protein